MHVLYDQQDGSLAATFGALPNPVVWPDGAATHGASVGHQHAERWLLLEAVYVDGGPPSPYHTEDGRSHVHANGRVEITRTWQVPSDLAPIKAGKIASAWAEQEKRLAAYIIQVPISGLATPFGCDPVSSENVLGINALIDKERGGLLPAGTIPNPRGFTPKGATSPVQVTHAEFALIGAYMAGAKDQHYVAYAVHKAAISALGTAEAINSYDITTGWPV